MGKENYLLVISEGKVTIASTVAFGDDSVDLRRNIFKDGCEFEYDGWTVYACSSVGTLRVYHQTESGDTDYWHSFELVPGTLTLGLDPETFVPLAEFEPTEMVVRLRPSDYGLTEVRQIGLVPMDYAKEWTGAFSSAVQEHAATQEMHVVLGDVPGYYFTCVDQEGNVIELASDNTIELSRHEGVLTFTCREKAEKVSWVVICRRTVAVATADLKQSAVLLTTCRDVEQLAESLDACLDELGISSFLDVCQKFDIWNAD